MSNEQDRYGYVRCAYYLYYFAISAHPEYIIQLILNHILSPILIAILHFPIILRKITISVEFSNAY